MRVFVTGATGYIGSAVVRSLVAAGHEVGGLVRSREKEAVVKAMGAVPIFGHLADPELYQHFAAESAAVIHTAFESPASDLAACEALISAQKAEGYDKIFILTSGVLVLGDTGGAVVDETGSTENPWPGVAWRPANERYVLGQAEGEFVTAVVRPGFVYGGDGRGVLASYVQSAVDRGASEYVGDGTGVLSYVHVDDLADLYRLIAEKRAKGVFHGVDDSTATHAEIATAVSRAAGKDGKTKGVSLQDAEKAMGPFASAFVIKERVRTSRAQEVGWKPKHKGVLDDVARAVKAAKP